MTLPRGDLAGGQSWPVRRPPWVQLAAPGVAGAALAGIACCVAWPYVVTIGLLLEWVSIRRQRTIIAARSGTLSLTSDRQWRWESAQGVRLTALCPVRVWVGPSWITLHFARRGGLESKEAMLQVTLWKSQTSPQSWRWLRVCLAGRVARPEVVPGRVGQ